MCILWDSDVLSFYDAYKDKTRLTVPTSMIASKYVLQKYRGTHYAVYVTHTFVLGAHD